MWHCEKGGHGEEDEDGWAGLRDEGEARLHAEQ